MAYKTKNNYEEEPHPWEPFIPTGAKKILLGTFPTAPSNRGAYEFFYPNPNNEFWRVLFKLDDKDLADYNKIDPIKIRKQILSNLNIGIADMGIVVLRQQDSSKDDNLFPVEFTDIFSLLDLHQSIRKIIITSSSGSNSVLSWFNQYCQLNNVTLKIPNGALPKKTSINFNKRNIIIEIISSTSRLSPIKGAKLLEMYRNAIFND